MSFYINSSRHYLNEVMAAFALETMADMLVLDAGAGDAPYRHLFRHVRYETADLKTVDKPYADVTYECDLADIPVEDNRFDRIIFNQVLEHVPDPANVLAELCRVMKPGGKMVCSAPLLFDEHEQPYDFYRYTQFAYEPLFSRAGLKVDRIFWLEGYFGTFAYQLRRAGRNLPVFHPKLNQSVVGLCAAPVLFSVKVFARLLAGLFSRLDLVAKIDDRGMPLNYVVLAHKPDGAVK